MRAHAFVLTYFRDFSQAGVKNICLKWLYPVLQANLIYNDQSFLKNSKLCLFKEKADSLKKLASMNSDISFKLTF